MDDKRQSPSLVKNRLWKGTVIVPMLMFFYFLCGSANVYAQQRKIQGKVTDNLGEVLAGVAVTTNQNGKLSGTSSDVDGNYTIEASEGDVLEFSFVGFQNRKVSVGSSDIINVTLVPDVL